MDATNERGTATRGRAGRVTAVAEHIRAGGKNRPAQVLKRVELVKSLGTRPGPAEIEIGAGITINTGDYTSVRSDAVVRLSCEQTKEGVEVAIQEARDVAKEAMHSLAQDLVAAMQQIRNPEVASPRGDRVRYE